MPRGGKAPSKKGGSSLGRTLVKNKAKQPVREVKSFAGKNVAEADGGDSANALSSYLEGSSLDDFLHHAVLSGRQFVAEKENAVVLEGNGMAVIPENEIGIVPQMDFSELPVPRRPSWDKSTTAEELNEREKEAFLDWRRNIAQIEAVSEELSVTPFEKNLEVWRQLWRVIERSHVIIQILDARNPLFYRSSDLEKYVIETHESKRTLLLINKSDHLTEHQRIVWAEYFKSKNVTTIFFSAKVEQEKLDERARIESVINKSEGNEDDDESDDDDDESDGDDETQGLPPLPTPRDISTLVETDIYSREELLDYLLAITKELSSTFGTDSRIVIGMVGFPNVGKSSVINALLGAAVNTHTKRVAVGSTPGKTKHFQTLVLSNDVMLCDCPGLVFPSFVNSSSEMICCGVLSLAQLRSHVEPCNLLTRRIPKLVLEKTYGIKIPTLKAALPTDPVDTYTFLEAYARNRGFMTTGKGGPDTSRAGRVVLKDYVNGKLLYCHPPPDLDEESAVAFDIHLLAQEKYEEDTEEDAEANVVGDKDEGNEVTVEDKLEDAEVRKSAVSKRLKKHGRKGRKGRDRNPYDDSDMLGDQLRSSAGFAARISGKKNNRNQASQFTRATLGHHPTYQPPSTTSKSTSELE